MRDLRGLPGMRDYPSLDDLPEDDFVDDTTDDTPIGERMNVVDLKKKAMQELTDLAEGLNVENAACMRKQDQQMDQPPAGIRIAEVTSGRDLILVRAQELQVKDGFAQRKVAP